MFLQIVIGVFLILHGLVHLLYFGQSARYFELQPGMTWPDGAWVFSRIMGDGGTRGLAGGWLILAAVGFAAGGLGVILDQTWWQPIVVMTALFSSLAYILLWDGTVHRLHDQGWVGVLINIAILIAVLVYA